MNYKLQMVSVSVYSCRPALFWPGFLLWLPGLVDLIKVSGAELQPHPSEQLITCFCQVFIILVIISKHPKPSHCMIVVVFNTALAPLLAGCGFTAMFWIFSCYPQLLLLPIKIPQWQRQTACTSENTGHDNGLHLGIFLHVLYCFNLVVHRPIKRWPEKKYMI